MRNVLINPLTKRERVNAIQAEKIMLSMIEKSNKNNDFNTIAIKNYLITCIYTTQLYECDAISLLEEFLANGTLSFNKYNL